MDTPRKPDDAHDSSSYKRSGVEELCARRLCKPRFRTRGGFLATNEFSPPSAHRPLHELLIYSQDTGGAHSTSNARPRWLSFAEIVVAPLFVYSVPSRRERLAESFRPTFAFPSASLSRSPIFALSEPPLVGYFGTRTGQNNSSGSDADKASSTNTSSFSFAASLTTCVRAWVLGMWILGVF